jgi:type I restriction enzyme M protein
MDAAEYKHVERGLNFFKFISDGFEEWHKYSSSRKHRGPTRTTLDEYRANGILRVSEEARWDALRANAKQPTIGELIDDAMVAIERDNKDLKGILPEDHGRPTLDKQRLGEL